MSKSMSYLTRIATERHGAKPEAVKRWRNNGVHWTEIRKGSQVISYMLHETVVAKVTITNGETPFIMIWMTTGGFNTLTTRAAISEVLASWSFAGSVGSGGKKAPNMLRIAEVDTVVPFDREASVTRIRASFASPSVFTTWSDLQEAKTMAEIAA